MVGGDFYFPSKSFRERLYSRHMQYPYNFFRPVGGDPWESDKQALEACHCCQATGNGAGTGPKGTLQATRKEWPTQETGFWGGRWASFSRSTFSLHKYLFDDENLNKDLSHHLQIRMMKMRGPARKKVARKAIRGLLRMEKKVKYDSDVWDLCWT